MRQVFLVSVELTLSDGDGGWVPAVLVKPAPGPGPWQLRPNALARVEAVVGEWSFIRRRYPVEDEFLPGWIVCQFTARRFKVADISGNISTLIHEGNKFMINRIDSFS